MIGRSLGLKQLRNPLMRQAEQPADVPLRQAKVLKGTDRFARLVRGNALAIEGLGPGLNCLGHDALHLGIEQSWVAGGRPGPRATPS